MKLRIGLTAALVTFLALVTPARGENPEHVKQLLTTRECMNCDLSGADLSRTHLIGADLRGANLKGANLTEANLEGADLTGANLEGANLTGIFAADASFVKANLQRVNLTNARMQSADLEGVNLAGANLQGAKLSVARDTTTPTPKVENTSF